MRASPVRRKTTNKLSIEGRCLLVGKTKISISGLHGKRMKRITNKYGELCSTENIQKAAQKALKGKSHRKEVVWYRNNSEELNEKIKYMLENKEYSVSKYDIFNKMTSSGKIREIHKLPFYPDRIVQHCLLNVMSERWIKSLTFDSYNCIEGRGIVSRDRNHNMARKIKRALLSHSVIYALKWDIKKFYPSVDNDIQAECYRKDCKDEGILWLLDVQNYSNKGLPIGNPDSQLESHLILRGMDHFIKEELKVKHYFRYADDGLILSDSKKELHQWMWRIRNYLWYNLKLEMKENRRIFPVHEGIDMGGYVFYPGYTLVRKRIKKAMIKRRNHPESMASYNGILKHCNSHNLIDKVINKNNEHMGNLASLGIKIERPFDGRKVKIDKVVGEKIEILDFRILPSIKNDRMRVDMQVLHNGEKLFICGSYQYLISVLEKVPRSELPLTDVVILQDRGYYFQGTI